MRNNISDGVYILTWQDLDARENAAFQKGVKRGRLEERIAIGKEPVALNCANWKDGRCETCGAQHQGMEVSGDFKCPHFVKRVAEIGAAISMLREAAAELTRLRSAPPVTDYRATAADNED